MTDFVNEYCMHTATCGELRREDTGREVTLTGWAWHNRDHGGLIFCDLRDREGYTQVVVDPDCVSAEDFAKAEHLGREYVLKVTGTVRERGEEAVNPNMATGEIEVLASELTVLNTSVTPPFSIEDGIETDETTRMKWRYLDIRRPEMYQSLLLRHKVAQAMRTALNERGFLEVETPILANSTPEGARDYIVPSRPNPGKFYALPQSPQQFKQMLMVGGIERYYQIARCFRDEDLRADRQPEFTQVDIEMSFVHGDDVIDMMEGVMSEVLAAVGVEHEFPLQRMQYSEAMARFGCDRPDVRFGMELVDITEIVKNTGFKVFASVAQSGGIVKAINAKGAGDWSRGEVEKLADIAADNGAKGMAWVAFTTDGQEKSPIKKFFTDEEWAALKEAMDVEPGDLLLFAADKPEVANAVLSALRLHMADALDVPREGHALLWVVNFPMFKYDEDEKKYAAEHPRTRRSTLPSTIPLRMCSTRIWTKSKRLRLSAVATAMTWSWTDSKLAAARSVFTMPKSSAASCASAGLRTRRSTRSSATSSMRSSWALRLMAASRWDSIVWSCCLATSSLSAMSSRSRRRLRHPIL